MIEDELFYKYAKGVIDGNVIAGDYIKLACKRFINDLEDQRFDFRLDKVKHCIRFIESFKHYTGKHANKHFKLEPFQAWIVANLVGFYWADTNERRFTQSYIQMARKNGKSFFAGALCLYFFLVDGEASAEVLLLANSRRQAKEIDYKIVSTLAKQLDNKGKYLSIFRDSIILGDDIASIKVLSSEAKTGDGYNCSFGLIDEYHEATDTKMKDLVVSSQGMRESPHCCIITTAGFDKTKPCYSLRCVAIEILNKVKIDESLFIAIYELDEDDDWQDENNWIKSNPNLGVTVSKKYITEQITKAKNNPSDEVGVRTKTLNEWCDSSEVWIPETYILNSTKTVDIKEHRDQIAYVGIDLAATSDFTAMSVLLVDNNIYSFKTKYYLPEDALESKSDKELYKLWVKMGYLTITPGNVTDYDYVLNDLMELSKTVVIEGVYYDKWNCTQFANSAVANGINMVEYSQNLANFNRPTRELERLLLSNNVILDNNEITRFCFRNVVLKSDWNGNCKPDKSSNKNKIDGVIAMLMCLGGYLSNIQYTNYSL